MYVAKCVDIDSTQYTKSTPNDIIYENMDAHIMEMEVNQIKKELHNYLLMLQKIQ